MDRSRRRRGLRRGRRGPVPCPDDPVLTDVPSFTGLDLQRVLVTDRGDRSGVVHVLAVECYADGLIVRWACPVASRDQNAFPGVVAEITDDVGTTYWFTEGHSSDGGGSCRGEDCFVPAPPGDATTLVVTTVDSTIELSLR